LVQYATFFSSYALERIPIFDVLNFGLLILLWYYYLSIFFSLWISCHFHLFSYYCVRGTSLHVTIFMLSLLMHWDFNFGVIKTFSCPALLAYGCVDETFGQIWKGVVCWVLLLGYIGRKVEYNYFKFYLIMKNLVHLNHMFVTIGVTSVQIN